MDAEVEQQAKDRGDKPSEGKGRADKHNPEGGSSGTQNQRGGENSGTGGGTTGGGNDPPLNPPGGNSGNRRNRSRSPRRTHFGGTPPPGGGPPTGGDPSSSDSFNDSSDSGSEGGDDSDMNKIQRLRRKLKSLERKKRRPHQPDRLDIKPFSGNEDDLHRFVLNVESKFDYHCKALSKDMDKICLIMQLLEGKAKKWYENIHVNINRDVAARQGVKFDKNNSLRKWGTFFALLQSSFGQSLTRDKSVQEWNRLRHREGNIDYFLDRIHHLIYATGYTGKMVKDKIKEGLMDEMRRSWAMVQGKPEKIYLYMDALHEFAREIESTAAYTKSQN